MVESALLHFHFERYEAAYNLLQPLLKMAIYPNLLIGASFRKRCRMATKSLLISTNRDTSLLRWRTLLRFFLSELYKAGLNE